MLCFIIYVSFIFIILQSFVFILIIIIIDDDGKELQRKRHLESPAGKSRVRKVAKCQPPSDTESDEESESEFQANFD